ncbi:NAD-binding protein [Dactylococcopsis salina]|uniref:K+ transport system, NAD-binding component n=1 Tax=Dactylococcopsis salina (strain PCC 8305) TaxID=13035 RepID=K9YTB6_DACS8|nr:NAD-binding protein [Dactylococcopsis salina]AFZ50144.1 K+ transport system, NAD-binding component [Dactylococcopsis salina PCC 8305]
MTDHFLVCGLGSLGQHCVYALKQFAVSITAIEQIEPRQWEIPHLPSCLTDLILGDCRDAETLQAAKIDQCRAILIVTSNERINAETAVAARSLSPHVRLVIRSGQDNLNQLLGEHLGNFIAFEPTELSADAFALAALGTETQGLFYLKTGDETEQQLFRVIKRRIEATDQWCDQRTLQDLNTQKRKVLAYQSFSSSQLTNLFYNWHPEQVLKAGDIVVYVQREDFLTSDSFLVDHSPQERKPLPKKLTVSFIQDECQKLYRNVLKLPVRRVALICGGIVISLIVIGTIILWLSTPNTTLLSSFYATVILLLGGYADLFGDLEASDQIQWWLQLFSLTLTIAGTALVGVLYALVTEALLSSKFELSQRRPPLPEEDHIIIIGIRRVGKRVAKLLLDLKQSLLGIPLNPEFDHNFLPEMPILFGNLKESLQQANLQGAKSVIVGTEDEMLNLEISLTIHRINPDCQLVIRTFEQRLSENLSQLLPKAVVLCAYSVVAEAFAGAAFGENIIKLFRLNQQTVLVTEYKVEEMDTLNGLLLADVAYGYNVVPILHQKEGHSVKFMPADDICLSVRDRLVVLATKEGLKKVELGELDISGKIWQVKLESARTDEALFEAGNTLVRVTGCSLNEAREIMNHLPTTAPFLMYHHQAKRLIRELKKIQVQGIIINQ